MKTYRIFKGTDSEYNALHVWVRKNLTKPDGCVLCGRTDIRLEWSNISGEYKKDLTDYRCLCTSCHRRLDVNGWYNRCPRGHELTPENTYIYPNGRLRECIICRKAHHKISNPKSYKGGIYDRTKRKPKDEL